MSSLCIKNASVIVTCDDQDSVLENSSILIEDGVYPKHRTADFFRR